MDGSSNSCMLDHGFYIIESTVAYQPLLISQCAADQGTIIIEPLQIKINEFNFVIIHNFFSRILNEEEFGRGD